MTKSYYIVTRSGRVDSLPEGGCALALGSFDGVHKAHKRVISSAIAMKEKRSLAAAGAWCFSSLPANILGNKRVPQLCTLSEKIERILDTGVDFVAVGDFGALAGLTAEEFIDDILIDKLDCRAVVCGFNHRFGKGGAGDGALLCDRFGKDNVEIVPKYTEFGEVVSSSVIRSHLAEGDLHTALGMLDGSYTITARVIGGKRLGRTIGYPTANQLIPEDIVAPAIGTYATLCFTEDGSRYIGVSNVGIRPTITDGSDNHVVNCETYLLNFNQDLYGRLLKVCFCYFLRDEKKFASVDELCAQIARDAEAATKIFEVVNIKP